MPSVLFAHENFPAQFGGIAGYLVARGWNVVFATAAEAFPRDRLVRLPETGLRVMGYARHRDVVPATHRYLHGTERAVLNGQGLARAAIRLRRQGFAPDLVVAHSGWGSGSFARAVWPEARFVPYLEWWYNYPPVDMAAETGESAEDRHAAALCRNLPFLLDLQGADAILVPTAFQRDQLPDWLAARATVIHDGVDIDALIHPPPDMPPFTLDGLPETAPLVTYATRGMEPMRGFPQFMADLAKLQAEDPRVHAVVAGEDSVHYGGRLPEGESWKARALAAHDFDMARLHFTGRLPPKRYRALLRRSDAHVYLTRPFVLSWSLLDAMAAACPLVVSDTAPVREAVPPDAARFVDFETPGEIARGIDAVLAEPAASRAMGRRARDHAAAHYAQSVLHPRREAFFRAVIEGRGLPGQ
ncbi:glycosyltransferase [Rhodovulum sulfidophilum]|uniref:glycosyltransferase n=1 Tax=Rhodovulum sulfidophilum TaxID=35806 RepID=UPI0019216A22|nr:glycosyltransferase [Rhodovulum sulfidophilum]MBL3564795.1 glycosyltransferase [Rhodovulum sulfidophilum]